MTTGDRPEDDDLAGRLRGKMTELRARQALEASAGRSIAELDVRLATHAELLETNSRLLETLLPRAEFCTGLKLFPTYCYGRIYRHGDTLARHCDRAACEISVSLNLGQEPDAPWPLHLGMGGLDVPVRLGPGDGLFYRGIELPHWREPFPGQNLTQVFLHYVDQNGPHRHERFDRRTQLSTPRPVQP